MERTLISWTPENIITIPLMAFAGFLLVGAVWQTYLWATNGTSRTANNSGGY